MKSMVFVTAALLAAFVTSSCSKSKEPAARPVVQLQQEWFPFAGFAGEISASRRFAATNGIDLKVLPGSEQVDPIKLVLAGNTRFGVASADLLIAAVTKGAPLVAIGVVNEQSPTVYLTPANSGIKSPKDFLGKKVGVLPGTNTERIYELMAKRQSLDRSKLTEIPIPFDLQTFLLGQYDVRPAFIYDEPVSLEQRKFTFNVIAPKDYGVQFIGTVYFTTVDTVKNDRALVVKFLRSLRQGWQFALKDPTAAVDDLMAEYPSLERAKELRGLQLGTDFFSGSGNRPLTCSTVAWEKTIQGLEELKTITPGTVSVQRVWDPSLLEEAYQP